MMKVIDAHCGFMFADKALLLLLALIADGCDCVDKALLLLIKERLFVAEPEKMECCISSLVKLGCLERRSGDLVIIARAEFLAELFRLKGGPTVSEPYVNNMCLSVDKVVETCATTKAAVQSIDKINTLPIQPAVASMDEQAVENILRMIEEKLGFNCDTDIIKLVRNFPEKDRMRIIGAIIERVAPKGIKLEKRPAYFRVCLKNELNK